MDLSHSMYQFISRWTFGLFPLLALMSAAERTFKYGLLCGRMFSFLLDMCVPRSRVGGSYRNSVLSVEELPDSFPKCLHHFTFPPTMYKGSDFCTLLLTFCL